MINYRIIERPAFDILGKNGWIAERDDLCWLPITPKV